MNFFSGVEKPRCSVCGSRKVSAKNERCTPRKTSEEPEERPSLKGVLDEGFKEEFARLKNAILKGALNKALRDLEDSRPPEPGRIFLRPEVMWYYNYVKRVFKRKTGKELTLEDFVNSVIVEHCTECLKIRPPTIIGDRAVG